MALDSMRRAYANDPIRELIEAREKAHKDELNRLHTAHREGLSEGLSQGLSQGRSEGQLQAARALKAAGVDPAIICQTLGLSVGQLAESD